MTKFTAMNRAKMQTLPEQFLSRMEDVLPEAYEAFLKALEEPSPVSIRVNRAKLPPPEGAEGLAPIPWSDTGYYLPERPVFTTDPLLHGGAYYVQEASSMFLGHALRSLFPQVPEGIRVLDLCGAPGGKSTLISSWLDHKGVLVANEVIQARSHILEENLVKWGMPKAVVTNSDPAVFAGLTHFFDIIVTDAPCSGEGMFRKDEGARNEWSPAHVELCCQRQRRILSDAWDALKPGGYLIYSTCTFNREENEEVARWVCTELGAESVPVAPRPEWNIHTSREEGLTAYRFYPHKVKGEGFFMTVLRKADDSPVEEPQRRKKKKGKSAALLTAPARTEEEQVSAWLTPDHTGHLLRFQDYLLLSPLPLETLELMQEKGIRLRSAGTFIAEVKKKNIVPQHALALSRVRNQGAFPLLDISHTAAIHYLMKKDSPEINEGLSGLKDGWVIVAFRGVPLGFVKKIGNRSNNYFPKEWRIQKAFSEDEYFTLAKRY